MPSTTGSNAELEREARELRRTNQILSWDRGTSSPSSRFADRILVWLIIGGEGRW